MLILNTLEELTNYIKRTDVTIGCLADTGFLYGATFDDDQYFEQSLDVIDILTNFKIPIFSNVVSRLEFVDLVFRKQVTRGAIQVFDAMTPNSASKTAFNLLKNIRDQNTSHLNQKNHTK
jgi:hypothetical protein